MPMSTLKLAALLLALGAVAAAPREFNFVKGECAGDTVYDDYFPFKSINSEDPADTYGAEAAPLLGSDYALLWTVEYFESHKVLTNTHSDTTYVLYQCGLDQPVVAGADKYVAVPVTRAAATTTMLLPWFEMLGEREALVAYTGAGSEVTSACINKMIEDGTCAENADEAAMQALDVEVTFADAWSLGEFSTEYAITNQQEGQASAAEKTVLKQAEYLEVIALFFNREAEAKQLMMDIVERFACTSAAVAEVAAAATAEPKVFWASYMDYGEGQRAWSVSDTCPNYYCEFVSVAGGHLITSYNDVEGDVNMWGTLYHSTAQILAGEAAEADVIIFADDLTKYPGLLDDLAALPAVANGRFYDIAARQGPGGGFDWFESRVAHPDIVLQDVAALLYPGTALETEHTLRYFHNVNDPVDAPNDECADVTAKAELFGELLPECVVVEGVPTEETDEPMVIREVEVDAAGRVAAAGLAFLLAAAL